VSSEYSLHAPPGSGNHTITGISREKAKTSATRLREKNQNTGRPVFKKRDSVAEDHFFFPAAGFFAAGFFASGFFAAAFLTAAAMWFPPPTGKGYIFCYFIN